MCGTSNAAQVQEALPKLLPERDAPFILQPLRGGKKREWQVQPRLEHPLAVAMRKVDLFVPLLTGDPASKAADIVGGIVGAASSQGMSSDQDLDPVIRQSCITSIILLRLLLLKILALKPLDIAEFGKTNAQALLAATEAMVQSQALQRAKDAR